MNSFASPKITREEVEDYAKAYQYQSDVEIHLLVDQVKRQGYLTKAEMTQLGEWKSKRIRSRLAKNSEELIREATAQALATQSPALAIHLPMVLHGVGMPVASALLHWFHADPFPILDFRALWTMGIEMPTQYSIDFWEMYVGEVRTLRKQWDIDMRTLDRALWQYSATHQSE